MSEYLELHWSVEDTINNLKELKDGLQKRCIIQNLHGRGERDAEEIAFDFDRAIKALEEVEQYRAIGTPEECKENVFLILDAYKKGIDNFAELLKDKLVQKYANARLEQQYVALQVTDWCKEIAEKLKGAFDDVET